MEELAIFLIPVITVVVGILFVTRKGQGATPANPLRFVALSTGILIAIAFSEFVPHALAQHSRFSSLWLVAGLFFILLVENYLTPHLHFFQENKPCQHHHPPHGHEHLLSHVGHCSAISCLFVCAFFDGLQLRSAFFISDHVGMGTALGLLLHIIPEGAMAASIALAGGLSLKKAKFITFLTAIFLTAGMLCARFLAHFFMDYFLAFAAGILIYVTFIHLIPLALKQKRGVLLMLIGCGFFMLLHTFAGHHH